MTNIEKLLNHGTVRSIAEVLANVCELCAGCGYRLDDDSCGAMCRVVGSMAKAGGQAMTNEEYLRSCPTSELARYITACGYCAYLTDGRQRGAGCIEGHKMWLAQERKAD